METISISDGTFYWLIKSDNKYFIEIKDFSEEISKQKYKEAQKHFCGTVLPIGKND